MSRPLRLEVFEDIDGSGAAVTLARGELEENRLAAFEQGYTAGWDDAAAAQTEEVARLRADLGRNLQDMAFSYHEARSHVLRALEPLLHDMVTKVLPAIAREALGQMVLEQLRPVAEGLSDAPVTVTANPANRAVIEAIVIGQAAIPMTFCGEPSLGEGQVYLRFGAAESRVDLDGVIATIAAAVSAFFQIEKERDIANG
ncbi:MAG: flagellar biosynthesis protein [Alphaproteobacteria bacterium HGW-Alphaproteobacteria-6]|nr:MAG: flagellar biosynthesis protein [Alphaproteobacteria bacterium HGW-Alphaproteobacteria-6]